MSYKEIFKIALLLISSPARAWEEIRLEEDKRKVFTAFVYPMIGLCTLSVFLGILFARGWGGPESFQIATRSACVMAVALFGGYFLAAYALNEVGVKLFGLSSNKPLIHQFAGYSLVVTFLTNIVTGLFPGFTLVAFILQFYIVYVVWVGTAVLMEMAENQRLSYTLMASLLLIVCPSGIQFIFNRLLVILN